MARSVKNSDITFSSTASWAQVTELSSGYGFSKMMVKNYTDGDIQIAFGSTDFPDWIVKQDTDMVIDEVFNESPIYVRNLTGTGGDVYLKMWSDKKGR